MNRSKRRETKDKACARLKKAKGYILVAYSGDNGFPALVIDLERVQDQKDLRHQALHHLAQECKAVLNQCLDLAKKLTDDANAKRQVEDAKEKRSEDLKAEVVGEK